MFKKVFIFLVVLAAVLLLAFSLLSRKAPALIQSALEDALGKPVEIKSIHYEFPATFKLAGFKVRETAPFEGEESFQAGQITLTVSALSPWHRELLIHAIEVEDARVTVRAFNRQQIHVLARAVSRRAPSSGKTPAPSTASAASPAAADEKKPLPLRIQKFELKNGTFQFIDYDVHRNGFVTVFENIQAELRDVAFPASVDKTFFNLKGYLGQGREQRPAFFEASGWTVFKTKDTDANFSLRGLFLPFFRPYYGQVTQADITNGYLDMRSNLRVQNNELTFNADLEIIGLFFHTYELGGQLFGLNANEILTFLKDQSGRLRFQIVSRWNIADPSVSARQVIRKSIERSLKNTILGNVGNILENTLSKIQDKNMDDTRQDIEETLDVLKELFG